MPSLSVALLLASMGPALPAQDPAARPAQPYGATPPALIPYRDVHTYRRFYLDPLTYRGPGRERPAPQGLTSVRLGLLAPLEGTADDRLGQALRDGVELALARANAAGGLGGLPFELVVRNDRAAWGSSANSLVELAYREQVWAVIGSIDSNSTHVALRVALKCELPMVNVGSCDPTVTETGIPWILRCTPDDRQTCHRLVELLFGELDLHRVALLRSTDRYGRLGVAEFLDAARRLGRPLAMEILFEPGQEDLDAQLARVRAAGVEAMVIWSKGRDAGRLVRRARELGLDQPIFGAGRVLSPQFLEQAGRAAEGVIVTSWMDPAGSGLPGWTEFVREFRTRHGHAPDALAGYGYDAATLVVEQLRAVGLNRARLRDALLNLREHQGITGTMRFDQTANNLAPLGLARVTGGRFVAR